MTVVRLLRRHVDLWAEVKVEIEGSGKQQGRKDETRRLETTTGMTEQTTRRIGAKTERRKENISMKSQAEGEIAICFKKRS